MRYRQQQPPGCGGCLLIAALFILLTGGAPALMSFIGTIFYFVMSLALLGIGGFMIFSWLLRKRVSEYEQSQTENHNRFVWLLVNILITIAKIDGQITRAEVQTIHNFFQINLRYNQTQMSWVKELIKEATNSDQPLDTLCVEFRQTFPYEHRFILLELVYQILFTKSSVPETELNVARHIAQLLQISSWDQQTLENKYRFNQQSRTSSGGSSWGGRRSGSTGSTVDEAATHYATLGLSKGASASEIKKAYRTLSMQYHPDKVRNLGEEFQKMAEEKMKEINVAHDYFERNGYL